MSISPAERILKEALIALGLPARGSYRRQEVCTILGITERTFWRLLRKFPDDGSGLKSFLKGNARRVAYEDLVDFISRGIEGEVMQGCNDRD